MKNKEQENITTSENLSEIELQQQKYESVMNAVNDMTAYYRSNPHRFCEEYLNIHLKLFQKIMLYAMVHNNFVIYVASRG